MGNVDKSATRKENDLGMTLGANLKMFEQCGIAALKANRMLGLIRRNLVHEEEFIIPLYNLQLDTIWNTLHKPGYRTIRRI